MTAVPIWECQTLIKKEKKRKQKRERKGIEPPPRIPHTLRITK